MFDLHDTIVAPATPIGESAVAIVRISGPRAFSVCDQFVDVSAVATVALLIPRMMVLCSVRSVNGIVDRGLIVRFVGPASFSGEDLVELHLHGNPLIVDLVLSLAVAAGARLADRGEFTRRAFMNGKIELTHVEGLSAAIRAESERSLFQAQRQLNGELSALFGGLRTRLLRLLGLLELELDFSEEGYALAARSEVLELVSVLRIEVERLLGSFRSGQRLLRGPRVLLLGLPNAGKSSLFNALVGYVRTLVSPVPGTTRDYVEERVLHNGVVLHLIDSAGVRQSVDSVETGGIELALNLVGLVDHVVVLIDSAGDHSASERLIERLEGSVQGLVLSRVYTKSDLAAAPVGALAVSVFHPASVERVLDYLVDEFTSVVSDSLSLLTRRQFDLLGRLRLVLGREDWGSLDSELLSYELRAVLVPLDMLSGEIVTDEILDEVFSSFCIGK